MFFLLKNPSCFRCSSFLLLKILKGKFRCKVFVAWKSLTSSLLLQQSFSFSRIHSSKYFSYSRICFSHLKSFFFLFKSFCSKELLKSFSFIFLLCFDPKFLAEFFRWSKPISTLMLNMMMVIFNRFNGSTVCCCSIIMLLHNLILSPITQRFTDAAHWSDVSLFSWFK